MAKPVRAGATDRTEYVFIPDASQTDGRGLTGLAYNTGSLVASYVRTRGSRTAITLATQTVSGAHSDGGFVEVDATNLPGLYRLDPPDAAYASGADEVVFHLKGAANMAPVSVRVTLAGVDVTSVSGDTAAADNLEADYDGTGYAKTAVADAARGIVAAGTLSGTHSSTTADLGTNAPANDITGQTLYFPSHKLARVVDSYNTGTGVATFSPSVAVTLANAEAWVLFASAPASTGAPPTVTVPAADIRSAVGLASANLDTQLAAIEAQTDDIGTAGAGLTAVPWNAAWDAEVQSEVQDAIEANHLDHLLATTYDPASKPGAADALLNELVENDAGVARYSANALEQAPTGGSAPTVTQIRQEMDSNSTQLAAIVSAVADVPTNAELATALGTADDATLAAIAALNDLDAAGIRAAVGLASANLDTQLGDVPTNAELATALDALPTAAENAAAVLTTAMTESYSTASGTKTLAQALYELFGLIGDFAVSGTTLTIKKLDGTDAATFTLDSATAPTSITRAT